MFEEFPHTITFQKYEKIPDGGGGYEEDWVNYLTTEGHVQPVSSEEFQLAQQTQNPIDHKVFFPYAEGIKSNMRIKWGEKILEIKSSPLDQGGFGEILMVKARLL